MLIQATLIKFNESQINRHELEEKFVVENRGFRRNGKKILKKHRGVSVIKKYYIYVRDCQVINSNNKKEATHTFIHRYVI